MNNTKDMQDYVIQQNKKLSEEIEKLRVEINDLKNNNNTLEEDNERLEKSIIYIRGVFVNEHLMNTMQEKNINDLVKIINKSNDQKVIINNYYFLILFIAVINLLASFSFYFIYNISIFYISDIIFFLTSMCLIGYVDQNIIIPLIFYKRLEEYKELKDSQDYLTELVNNC